MRCLFTQWTAPAETNPIINDKYSGFPDFETFLWSWICSVNLAKKHFDTVELYCDTPAKQILVDQLGLEFDKVHITLDNKEQYKNIWAYGKMDTYARQTEPFVHLDADLFLYKKLDYEYKYPYFFWTEEGSIKHNNVYLKGYQEILKLPYTPKILLDNPVDKLGHNVCNVGLFYVANPFDTVFQEYTKELKTFFEKNENDIKKETLGCSPVVLEQYLIHLLLKKHKTNFSSFLKSETSCPSASLSNKCIHFLSSTKIYHSKNIKHRAIMLTGKKYISIIEELTKKIHI